MNKLVDRAEAIKAANTLLGYCHTFRIDNEARAKLLKSQSVRRSGVSFIERKRQLANHKGQKHYIKKIEILAKDIHNILENEVTYRK